MSYAISTATPLSLQTAIARVREALAAEGFDVLGEIDVQAMLREQLGTEIEPEILLEACNAARVPCSIAVRVDDGETIAEAVGRVDPQLQEPLARVVESVAS